MILNLLFTLHHKSMKMSIKSSNHNWIKNCKKRCKVPQKKGLQNEVHYKDIYVCANIYQNLCLSKWKYYISSED